MRYLTFGSFTGGLLSIIISYEWLFNSDKFELSTFVIIFAMFGLVLAYEWESGTGKYIQGLLKDLQADKVQLALGKLARTKSPIPRHKNLSKIFSMSVQSTDENFTSDEKHDLDSREDVDQQ